MSAALLLCVLALVDSTFNYFWTGNGIHGSEGALLVTISTLLLVLAVGVVLNSRRLGWLGVILKVLIVLDFLGTGLAAYFLEAWILLALIALAFIGWLAHALRPASRPLSVG